MRPGTVRFLRDWLEIKAGTVMQMDGGIQELVDQRIVERVVDQPQGHLASAETAALEPPKRKRGRPRKVREVLQ